MESNRQNPSQSTLFHRSTIHRTKHSQNQSPPNRRYKIAIAIFTTITITITTHSLIMRSQMHPPSPIRPPPAARPRMNSKDIPRTYSGLYGEGCDLLPFELSRNRNTDWVSHAGWQLLGTYLAVIFMVHLIVLGCVDFSKSWTYTATLHCLVTMVYLHWIKGSPNFYEQGEMNAMTFWEQLDSTEGTSNARTALLVVPTLLCYAACHFSNYNLQWSLLNILVWLVCIIGKLPFMNGVRILGINRTTGIDDYDWTDPKEKKS